MRARLLVVAFSALLLAACTAQGADLASGASGTATPSTRAARTAAARGTETPIPRFPTAQVLLDRDSGRPIWPTPPPTCSVSPAGNERPDLGPTIGEAPILLASQALPVIPWRNDFVRVVWVVDRALDGDLILSGRRTDGEGTVRFIRQGGERATEQLHVPSAGRIGAANAQSPETARYADIQVRLALPAPGCYELQARLGEVQRAYVIHVYS